MRGKFNGNEDKILISDWIRLNVNQINDIVVFSEWKLCERFYCLFQYAIQENKSFETHFNDTSARPHFTPILAILNWNFDLARLITHFCVFVCLCSYFRYLHTSALGEFYQFVDSHHLATTCTNTWIVNFFASLCEYKCVNSPSMRASSKWNLFKIQRKLALLCIPSIAFLSPCDFNASDLFPYLNSDPWFFIHEYTIFFFAVFIRFGLLRMCHAVTVLPI